MSELELSTTDESVTAPAIGSLVTGVIMRVEADTAYIDFGYASEGQIARAQWSTVSGPALQELAAVGDSVRAVTLGVTDEGVVRLSRKNAVNADTWERLRADSENETIQQVKVINMVKGGLVIDVEGLRAFLPASLVDLRFVADLKPFLGQTIAVVITEVDENEKKIILSRKRAVELADVMQRGEKLGSFEVGQVVTGTVARFTSFGAFVDVGDVDGLLHVSEISWSRVERPESVLHVGQQVTVKILRIDPANGKLSLSLRETQQNPWTDVEKRYNIGDVISGTVKRLSSFGAFVEVEPGIEGLVHVSQIANRRVAEPSEVLEPGQTVQAKILDIRADEERMSLSLRDAGKTEERKKTDKWVEKQVKDPAPGTTLGDLFGDLFKDKFK